MRNIGDLSNEGGKVHLGVHAEIGTQQPELPLLDIIVRIRLGGYPLLLADVLRGAWWMVRGGW